MPLTDKKLEQQLEALLALGDPVRRALYLHVAGRTGEVSRDQAARGLKISRSLAAFHLDKLVEAGLLEASYRRLSGRSGPGAGRPSKLYRKAARQIEVTLPARRYELAARLLMRATENVGPVAAKALARAAEEWGREVGREARERAGDGADPRKVMRAVLSTLELLGFEPRRDAEGEIVLGNCPFDSLRSESQTTICGMNLALCRGLVEGLEIPGCRASLEPAPGRCCVLLRAS